MVDSHYVVKLIDFGASKQQSTVGGATASTGISYTNGYAPSEQMAQSYDKFGPWTDFYALGATLFKLLTNQDPPSVTDISEDETEDKHLALPMPNVSEEMKKLVVWMMQVNRLKRPKNVGEIRRILQQTSVATSNNEETKAFGPYQSYANPVSDDEETVWADKAEKVETEVNEQEKCNEKEQTNSSNSHIYLKLMVCLVIALLVILAILFLPQSARTAANTNVASTDSDSAYYVGEANADSDGVYVENKEEVFFNQTVKYTGTVLTNPDPGRFYPCDDKGELTFSDGRKYKGPFNRGRMEGDNATFIYPNGDIYTGSFYDNHFSNGTYTVKSTGEQFIGTFDSNGQPKKGAWYDKNGNFLQNV